MISPMQIMAFIKHMAFAKKGGHGVHSPFVYRLCENIFSNKESFYVFEELADVRKKLLKDNTVLEINDVGAGSKSLTSNKRKISEIVAKGNSTQKQSEFYFKLINYFQCQSIIELGTSVGLNTLYLAKANPNAKVFSIEACDQLSKYATRLIEQQDVKNVQIINGNFDFYLPKLLSELQQFDLLYVDGNHTYEATIRYFHEVLDYAGEKSIIIFDDIYWSAGMKKAWEYIKNEEKVTLSIDCFYFGIVFFRKEQKQQEHFNIYF
jgi:predicted O-methyltransferase YrrM